MKITTIPNNNPNKARNATSMIGLISCTAILIHMKDELQIAPSKIKIIQCLIFKSESPFDLQSKNSIVFKQISPLETHFWLHYESSRVMSEIQLVSHVFPPSMEKACSQRQVVSVILEQINRTKMLLPSRGS